MPTTLTKIFKARLIEASLLTLGILIGIGITTGFKTKPQQEIKLNYCIKSQEQKDFLTGFKQIKTPDIISIYENDRVVEVFEKNSLQKVEIGPGQIRITENNEATIYNLFQYQLTYFEEKCNGEH